MVKAINRLTALKADKLKLAGMHPDGGGLYLQVSQSGARSWVFRYRIRGARGERYMGLGPFPDRSLADARISAAVARELLRSGLDPLEERDRLAQDRRLEAARSMTFREAAEGYIAAHEPAWSNPKHSAQWRATLAAYAFPTLGELGVQGIDTGLILKVLEPVWSQKPETASRVRGRIERILDWATARGLRRGENPARWRGHLAQLLPAKGKVRAVRHHAALPFAEAPAFVAALKGQAGLASQALHFTILTASRASEVVGARWGEVSSDLSTWTIPAARMKARRDHRVPLSPEAAAILKTIRPLATDPQAFVFPGLKRGKGLTVAALSAVLARMKRDDLTTHGFRSTFRDWCAEATSFPNEVSEMALAHVVSDKTEAAYRRGDLLDKRKRLMEAWARYCEEGEPVQGDNVVAING